MTEHQHSHTKCLQLFARMSEYIDNELDEATCREIERHISTCAPCQVCLATLKRTITLCKHLQEQPVPKDLRANLKRIIDNLS